MAVSRRLGIGWKRIAGIGHRAVHRGLDRRKERAVASISVGGMSDKKRHKYLTIVSDYGQLDSESCGTGTLSGEDLSGLSFLGLSIERFKMLFIRSGNNFLVVISHLVGLGGLLGGNSQLREISRGKRNPQLLGYCPYTERSGQF